MSYRYEIAKPEAGTPPQVIIRELDQAYVFDANGLKNQLFHLRLNRRAYVDESLYNNMSAMLEGALKFLQEEQS